MKALTLHPSTASVTLREVEQPIPMNREVLIRVVAVAFNTVDETYVSRPIAVQESRIISTDFAGVIAGAHPGLATCQDLRVKEGTRVAGFLQGACSVNDRSGAFAEYVTAPFDLLWVVHSDMNLQSASSVSMCALTAAQGVFLRLKLPCPFLPGFSSVMTLKDESLELRRPLNILINGAASSIGLYAAQLIQLSTRESKREIRLFGTASPSKHTLLSQQPYSYHTVFDYRDANWVTKVLSASQGYGIDMALDTISEGETVGKVHETLGPSGKFGVFRGPAGGRYDVSNLHIKPFYGAVWEGLGEEIGYNGVTLPKNPEARSFAVRFFDYLSSFNASSKTMVLEPNPVRLMPGGLAHIVSDGFALLGPGSVVNRIRVDRQEEYMKPISGEKLVYTINE